MLFKNMYDKCLILLSKCSDNFHETTVTLSNLKGFLMCIWFQILMSVEKILHRVRKATPVRTRTVLLFAILSVS